MSFRDVGISGNRETDMRTVVEDLEACWIGMWARDGGLKFGDGQMDWNSLLGS